MLRAVTAVGVFALVCVTFAPQQLFVPAPLPTLAQVQPVRLPVDFEPVQARSGVPAAQSGLGAGMLGWGLLGFGAVATLAIGGRYRAREGSYGSFLATRNGARPNGRIVPVRRPSWSNMFRGDEPYNPDGHDGHRALVRSPGPMGTGAIRQTVADMGKPEWIQNASGEWVRNDFGSRAVNPSEGLAGDSPRGYGRYSSRGYRDSYSGYGYDDGYGYDGGYSYDGGYDYEGYRPPQKNAKEIFRSTVKKFFSGGKDDGSYYDKNGRWVDGTYYDKSRDLYRSSDYDNYDQGYYGNQSNYDSYGGGYRQNYYDGDRVGSYSGEYGGGSYR